jgi:clan AA aspartic protease (TIGR02281 family)
MRATIHTAVILLLMVLTLRADTIYLKNGRSIDGIVVKETDTELTLDLGVGSMRVKKSSVRKISVAESGENTAIEEKWQREHILHKRHLPVGMEPLAKEFQALEGRRASANAASRTASGLHRRQEALRKEVSLLQKQYLAVSRKIQWLDPKEKPTEYNATIAKNNAISAELRLKESEDRKIQDELGATSKAMANYLNALSVFDAKFTKAASEEAVIELAPAYTLFFEEIERRMSSFRSEYRSHGIVTTSRGGSTIVSVVINNSISATMILDTGASLVTISQALADKLKIDTSSARMTRVVLADGKTLNAHNITLSSLQAGSAVAQGIDAVVLPQSPGEGIDGLLGMSFLSRFRVKLDGSSSRLILEELDIKEK